MDTRNETRRAQILRHMLTKRYAYLKHLLLQGLDGDLHLWHVDLTVVREQRWAVNESETEEMRERDSIENDAYSHAAISEGHGMSFLRWSGRAPSLRCRGCCIERDVLEVACNKPRLSGRPSLVSGTRTTAGSEGTLNRWYVLFVTSYSLYNSHRMKHCFGNRIL